MIWRRALLAAIISGLPLADVAAQQIDQLPTEATPPLSAAPLSLQDIRTVFAFGDSYTSVHYRPSDGIEPKGSKQDIRTTSGGNNWIQYLSKHLDIENSVYDLAVSGSSIEPLVIHPGEKPNPCLINQTDAWTTYLADSEDVGWDPKSTLFVIAIGINDIANGIMTGADYQAKIPQLVDIYRSQFRRMYEGGARHFLVMPVPPFDRTPLARNGPHHELFVELVHLWNFRFYDMLGSLRSDFAVADVRSWDWHAAMDEIIDNASSYGFKELKGSCWPYARITHYAPMAQDAECHFPLSEYLWKDTAHPTWRVHELLSKEVIRFLSGEPPQEPTAQAPASTESDRQHQLNSVRSKRHNHRMAYVKREPRPIEPLVAEAGFA